MKCRWLSTPNQDVRTANRHYNTTIPRASLSSIATRKRIKNTELRCSNTQAAILPCLALSKMDTTFNQAGATRSAVERCTTDEQFAHRQNALKIIATSGQ